MKTKKKNDVNYVKALKIVYNGIFKSQYFHFILKVKNGNELDEVTRNLLNIYDICHVLFLILIHL